MTIQAQPPFTSTSNELGDDLLRRLTAMGNEVGLHLHENYHLGAESDQVQPQAYAQRMGEIRQEIEALSGQAVVTWSGGNTYDHIWEAAAEAGLTYNTNYKEPDSQTSDAGFAVVNPWRPLGAVALSDRLAHDPTGPIVYIPSGVFPVHCRMLESIPRPYRYEGFDYVTSALRASLASTSSSRINTFYVTFHPDDFLDEQDDAYEYQVWDAWLTEVIDPLVQDGRVVWATVGEMGEAYEAWEAIR
jgi:hypothetical protein